MALFDRFRRASFPVPPPNPIHALREQAYTEFFGEPAFVWHETEPRTPHIDVYRFDPRPDRNFYTYLSGGMSDLLQPDTDGDFLVRVEILFYAKTHHQRNYELVRNFAHYPFDTGSPYRGWELFGLGDYAERAVGSSRFTHFTMGLSTKKVDREFVGKLQVEGQIVYPLQLTILTAAEADLFEREGYEAFNKAVESSPNSINHDPDRESTV